MKSGGKGLRREDDLYKGMQIEQPTLQLQPLQGKHWREKQLQMLLSESLCVSRRSERREMRRKGNKANMNKGRAWS
jgi:hypothetical protein